MKYRLPQDAINPSFLHTRSACSTSKNVKKSLICLAIATSLSACGGGGGSSDEPDSPNIPDVIVDIINPVITLVGESNVNHQVGTPYTDAGATAVDNIDGDISLILSGSVDVTALGDNTLTYTATDAAGNQLTHTRIVSVVDEVNPVITLNGSAIVSHEINTDYIDAGALATDAFEGLLTVETTGNVNTAALGENTITYSAIDSSGNEELQTRTVNVVDTTKPVITLLGDNVGDDADNKAVTTEAGVPYVEAGATALDAIDGDLLVTITGGVNTAILADYPLTYKATDESGNEQTVTRIVSVIDTTKPVITLNGTAVITLEGGTTYTDLGATALDALDGPVNVTTTGTVNINAVGNYTITYNAVDAAGLTETATRTVTVVDTTEPVITLVGDSAVTIEAGLTYVDDSATAFDATDGQLIVTATSTVDTTMVGTYTVTYTVVDSVGLTQTLIRNVTVADNIKPDISLVGDSTVIVEGNSAYVDAGATAFDAIDGVLVVSTIGSIDTSVVGNQTLTYSATDNSGNVQTASRTVSVVDRIKPDITVIGDSTVIVEGNSVYDDEGATARDGINGVLDVTTTGSVDTSVVGDYILTYSATDSSNNTQTASRTVSVVDTTNPVISLTNGTDVTPVTVEAGSVFTNDDVSAFDSIDGVISVISDSVDTSVLGDVIINLSATDLSNNQATTTRTVTVVDTTSPVIVITGGNAITHDLNTTYVEQGAVVTDNLDDDSAAIIVSSDVDENTAGTYTVVYAATTGEDAAGNAATPVTRTVIVSDISAPVITLGKYPDELEITLGLGRFYKEYGATATDVVDGDGITVNIVSTVDVDTLGDYTVTYTATDSVGNIATTVRTVHIVEPRPMIVTYRVEPEDNGELVLGSDNEFKVDFGDGGGFETLTGLGTHNYGAAGDYQVKFTGELDRFSFCFQGTQLISIDDWGDVIFSSFNSSFQVCNEFDNEGTETIGEPDFLTANTNISFFAAFRDSNFNQPINHWDVSKVNTMASAFLNNNTATSFNQPLDSWDTSNVTNTRAMFGSQGGKVVFNQDISSWNVSKVTDMSFMFASLPDVGVGVSDFDHDLSAWQIMVLSDAESMFLNATLSTANYNALLESWSAQAVLNTIDSVNFHGGNSTTGGDSSADAARVTLEGLSWTIIDGDQP